MLGRAAREAREAADYSGVTRANWISIEYTYPFIYANNEPKSALARDLGDCRDNK